MSLKEYKRKRHFDKTTEPAGKIARRTGWSFVVQKHAARHLHYDFRLELGGVLKSWAVPKGPSLDPRERRLAVEVEDHPLEYGKFEGEIPTGSYGAGEVILWDRGTWKCEKNPQQALRQGKLEFDLQGEKLHGGWRLIRMPRKTESKTNWLLMKCHDEFERPATEYDITEELPQSGKVLGEQAPRRKRAGLKKKAATRSQNRAQRAAQSDPNSNHPEQSKSPPPAKIAPQLAMLAEKTPQGADWLHEIKFDGYRILCRLNHGKVKLATRRFQDWTHRYSVIAEEAAQLAADTAILDGEIVALLPSGISSFQDLQNAGKTGLAANLVYYVFDLLYLNGRDVRPLPLGQRKELLAELLKTGVSQRIQPSEHFEDDGPAFFLQCCQLGLEGVVSKRKDRPYRSGRNDDWLKSKCVAREELVIGGYTISPAVHRGFGALLVGYYDQGRFIYAGRVGTGFSNKLLLEMRKRLDAIQQDKSPFEAVPKKELGRTVRWVKPQLIAQFEFTGWTATACSVIHRFKGCAKTKWQPRSRFLNLCNSKSKRSRRCPIPLPKLTESPQRKPPNPTRPRNQPLIADRSRRQPQVSISRSS